MADEPWQIRLLQEAKASPGFWAGICVAAAVIGGSVLALYELKPIAFDGFTGVRGYGWLAVLVGGVFALFFGMLYWRAQPRSSSPEVIVPSLFPAPEAGTVQVTEPWLRPLYINGDYENSAGFAMGENISVPAGNVLIETLNEGGRIDFRKRLHVPAGSIWTEVRLEKVNPPDLP